MGTVVVGKNSGQKTFLNNGTFKVPNWVTKVWITGCGAGFGVGVNGGATTFGTLKTLAGGTYNYNAALQAGQGTPFGNGAFRSVAQDGNGNISWGMVSAVGYGSSGYSGNSLDARGGFAGQWTMKEEITVVPNSTIAITIGKASATGDAAARGRDGFLTIEW